MRSLLTFVAGFVVTAVAAAQEVPARFDVLYNPDLYKQESPQDVVKSVLAAIERDRYDYIVAHLLEPAFVDGRLADTRSYFERVAADQVAASGATTTLKGADLENRIRDVGLRLNVRNLAGRIRKTLTDEPDHLKELRRFARDGQFQATGDSATATLKDVKGAVSFKKINDRWFLENRKDDVVAPPKE